MLAGLVKDRDRIRETWPQIEGFIARARAKANGELLPIDVYERLLDGTMQLWIVADELGSQFLAIAVTEHSLYPRKHVLRVVLLAGTKMRVWQDVLDEALCAYGREMGATTLEAVGRRGFVRQLEPLGFKEKYTTVVKELT